MAFDLNGYKEVSERVADLFAKHPEASLRGSYEILALGDKTYIAYRAECFRTPDDPAPGIGTAWEQFPGTTSYTKGSELQNAETSAWGRAIVAVGASESKKIASVDEVRSARTRNAEGSQGQVRAAVSEAPSPQAAAPSATSPARRQKLKSRCDALQADGVKVGDKRFEMNLPPVNKCDEAQLAEFEKMVDRLEAELSKPFAAPQPLRPDPGRPENARKDAPIARPA